MTTRPSSDHDRARLKAATDRGIRRAGGGASLATQTRVEAAVLSKYKAEHEAGHFMPLDVALDCDLAAGAPVILSTFASLQGYAVAPLDAKAAGYSPNLVGNLIRETGEVSAVVLEAWADGKLTPRERQAIEKELDEAMAAMWLLRAALRD